MVIFFFGKYNQRDINPSSIRENISYIHQDPVIFNDTIVENFRIANRKIKYEEIREICELVDLDKFICTLPNEYNTVLGFGGIQLSGGEKQRLAIAIALAKKSKILLLDEITSDLDGNTESKMIDIIKTISEFCTVIMISHRLSSIKCIPNIYVLKDGVIVAQGNHDILSTSSNDYLEIVGQYKLKAGESHG